FGQSGSVRVELDKSTLPLLARAPGVMYVDRFVQPSVSNDIARWVIQSGDTVDFATPVHDHGIYGTGQLVTLGDTGLDFGHPDFADPNHTAPGPDHRKVKDYYSPPCPVGGCNDHDDDINHGTHTSGSIGGDDGVWHVYNGDATGSHGTTGPHDGQAFDAFLEMQDLSAGNNSINFNSVTDLWQMAMIRDSWIHSDSWGSCCTAYIQESADTDQFIWNNQHYLGSSDPGPAVLHGRMVPDREPRTGEWLHALGGSAEVKPHQLRTRDGGRGCVCVRRDAVPELRPRVRACDPGRRNVLCGRCPGPRDRRPPRGHQHGRLGHPLTRDR